MQAPTLSASSHVADDDDQYPLFLRILRQRFDDRVSGPEPTPIFTTAPTTSATASLFDVFLEYLPPAQRQHYNCHACRRFVDRFGGLVTIDEAGVRRSLFWDGPVDEIPALFREAVADFNDRARYSPVTGVFLSPEKTWGLPSNVETVDVPGGRSTRTWHHMAVIPPAKLHFKHAIHTALQVMAEKEQDYAILCRGLADFPITVVRQAHAFLTNGALARSEKHIGVATWLLALHEARDAAKSQSTKNSLTWRAVALAPAGFCHVGSSMIGTLLEDIAKGMAFSQIKKRFDEKMDPLKYMRPQAPPAAGNIAEAEKLVERLGLAPSLERRFAKLEDVQALWTPKPPAPEPTKGAVFGHLKPKGDAAFTPTLHVPPVTMTWVKFRETILPTAESMEVYIPSGPYQFTALITAVHPDAPPILQWDHPEKRNPVSWYVYKGGSPASQWGLRPLTWQKVTAVSLCPSKWADESGFQHQGNRALFLLEGAWDQHYNSGGGFFPENLKSELHSIRSTLEAYAMNATIAGKQEATACGVNLQAGIPWTFSVRVTTKGIAVIYKLDRWD